MLNKIRIKNLAIIEDIEIEFNSNFTALTGATGAGKSLVIDSLKLIFGKRADSDYIRYGETEAVVVAYFNNLNKKVIKYLSSLEINDNNLVIERWISKHDRNKIIVNDKQITLRELQQLGYLIGDIHEQHDTTKLLDPETALIMLDQLGQTEELKNKYILSRHKYIQTSNKYNNALIKTKQTEEKLEELKYELNELSKANLSIDELEQLEHQINVLSHQKEIVESLTESYINLKKIDDDVLIYNSFLTISKIKEINESYLNIHNRLESSYYELTDIKEELYDLINEAKDISLNELEIIQERYYFLKDLEKKYSKTIDELITYKLDVEEEILKIENYDEFLSKLKEDKIDSYNKAYKIALDLSKKRKQFATVLEKDFITILKRLDIDYVDFKVEFNKVDLKEEGIDEITFLISLNEGEPLKPFYKVASGGELSRSMLALKILFAKIENLSLMVFDEIDLGISGDAASKVAYELLTLSNDLQIIAITHLPQVAARANKHYHIEKKIESNRTITIIKDLNNEDRLYHLAYMLSGKDLTEGALLHAKSLLEHKKKP